MTVKEIKPNILYLEYRQEKIDKDYGSCGQDLCLILIDTS